MVYNQYPQSHNQYPKGTPLEFPYPSQYFTGYNDQEIIARSSNKDPTAPLIVTSGVLRCEIYKNMKQGFTDTYNFRVLMNGLDENGKRIGWTNSITNAIVTPVMIQPNQPSWAGIHLFSRYQTSDDLYVASFRFDGKITIKKKINGKYTTLAITDFSLPQLGITYKLQFTVKDSQLSFYIDGVKVLTTQDYSLLWGTSGLRIDYTDCYIKQLRMTTPK